MLITPQVDLPEWLLLAQRHGRLVVFAGKAL
jgi:hypothetical protein